MNRKIFHTHSVEKQAFHASYTWELIHPFSSTDQMFFFFFFANIVEPDETEGSTPETQTGKGLTDGVGIWVEFYVYILVSCKQGSKVVLEYRKNVNSYISPYYENTPIQIQSNLVISNSLISNYRLSRSENLVPVLTWNYDNRYQNNVEKRRNCS